MFIFLLPCSVDHHHRCEGRTGAFVNAISDVLISLFYPWSHEIFFTRSFLFSVEEAT
jgi:hypothetical protein